MSDRVAPIKKLCFKDIAYILALIWGKYYTGGTHTKCVGGSLFEIPF